MREMTWLDEGWKFYLGDALGFEQAGADDSKWEQVTIPHDWAVSRPIDEHMEQGGPQGFLNRWGVGWYRLNMSLSQKDENAKYALQFGGVFENCRVFVNGQFAGEKLYGYSGFSLDVTKLVHQGDNLLAVRVDNTIAPVDRWYSGCGIYRRVCLLKTNPICFDPLEIVVKTEIGAEGAKFQIDTGMKGYCVQADCMFKGVPLDTAEGDGCVTLQVRNPFLWSAETPNLYELELALMDQGQLVDRITLKAGIREVEFKAGAGLFVNGKEEKLKGVCLHHDAGCVGSAVTKSLWRRRLELLKGIGCNAIRTSHNITSAEFMDLCDEMGFYVIDESFDKWTDGAYGRYFDKHWEDDLSYMIKRDRNRPSVIMWSVGNEVSNQGHKDMLALLRMLVGKTKELDDRPVTAAMSPHYWHDDGKKAVGVNEVLTAIVKVADCVDILALNYQEQWYEDIYKLVPDKLILGSETYLFFRGARDNYFNFTTENPWMDVEKNPYVIGGCLWAGIDYLGESMGYPSKGWCGAMIKTNLERKPISWLFESYWSNRPVVHISILDYTLQDDMAREMWDTPRLSDCWNFPMFGRSPMPYMIFSNCDEVKLYHNGIQRKIKTPGECESRIITGYLPLDKGTVRVEGLKNGEVVCIHELKTAQPASRLRFAQEEITLKKEHPISQILLTVYAEDANGQRNRRESPLVRFTLDGDGTIEGVDSGSLMNIEPFKARQTHMQYGAATAVLRITPGDKSATVSAYADGYLTAQTRIVLI